MPDPHFRRDALLGVMLLLLLGAIARPAAAQPAETPLDRMERVKQLQRDVMMREALERFAEAFRHRYGDAKPERSEETGTRRDRERLRAGMLAAAHDRGARLLGGGLAPNVRVNDPSGDEASSSQNEPSVAVFNDQVLVAYNDLPSAGFSSSLQGYAFSLDGGATFIDGGEVPAPSDTAFWTSDPVLSVNERTGEFYYCGLIETVEDLGTGDYQNGVAVMRATFTGSTVIWDPANLVRLEPATIHFIDKPWMVVDSLSDYLYASYTDYTVAGSSIAFQRSPFQGISWFTPTTLSPPGSAVQGSRPVVGPAGELYVTWKEIGPASPGYDFLRIRRSDDQGATFDGLRTVATFFDNYGTGAPGFNRERSVALPSIAVDRTAGPHRGRVYVTWNESLNWYDDVPAAGTPISEVEYNDVFAQATGFTPGQLLVGAFDNVDDLDYFGFSATQGSSYVFWAENVPASLYTMRVFCADTVTRLAFTGHIDPPLDSQGNQSILVWTCPRTGTYYLRLAYLDFGGDLGSYRVRTGPVSIGPGDRGRDQRDVFVAWSNDGANWSTPQRVNDDPPWLDNWLPEVTVSSFGTVFDAWYDWRDSVDPTCGGASQTYLARSEDGAATWTTLGALTSAPSNWNSVASNLVPNQGDYLSLFADDRGVFAAWTDGRAGNPDIFFAVAAALPESLQVGATANALPGTISLVWDFRVDRVITATLYRQQGDDPPVAIGTVTSDASGRIVYLDTNVASGERYTYSLGVTFAGSETRVGTVSAVVPTGRLLVRPNPLKTSTTIQFDVVQPGGAVTLSIFDLQGRLVKTLLRETLPPGPRQTVWDIRDGEGNVMKPGVYLVRLTQQGQTKFARISLIP